MEISSEFGCADSTACYAIYESHKKFRQQADGLQIHNFGVRQLAVWVKDETEMNTEIK
ncbi:MAG: hypothetical protein IPL71_15620 [Anaerolineales bacterium]|uniref:hypothetical protein n=1 Tax=Candidatus Villigracilis proximus TaxID=3140683 RepID=UPI003134E532|nr:hypothetical protein [Anaerolineales bacterium]